jgi:hypothetical protein
VFEAVERLLTEGDDGNVPFQLCVNLH